jgi:hypothetical protein
MLAADAGIARISVTGFTLKSELLHEIASNGSTKKAAQVAVRKIDNSARLIILKDD